MSETKDISRRRLDDFLAARLRARKLDQNQSERPSAETTTVSAPRPEERATPANES
jgi:hypothetical protein